MTITAETFVDAATHVCCAALELAAPAGVLLHRASGRTGLAVDNYPGATDDLRRFAVTEDAWKVNPVMIELRRQLAILGPGFTNVRRFNAMAREHGYQGIDRQPFAVPLLGSDGWFGTVVYITLTAPTAALERKLTVLAAELSVWCTARGISTLPEVRPLARRQHEVATLAATGRTNIEIAGALGISINTVKLRLKQAFERLGVENRTELVNMLRRLAPLDGVPVGITHRETITITRDTRPFASDASPHSRVAH